ncbi:MAG: glutamate--cysteine ligase [Mycobacteriaceae bacterium]|nr:glutamate--cysteine ligase [Mycobacteriaceae bacterium]MBV9641362.1 glutamate--cysteine ligase [Mycobacteriaceae bacterium]
MDEHPTIGVEEEFLLVDPDTAEPMAANRAVADEAARRGVKLQLELTSCQVETTTGVVADGAELGEELTRLRHIAAEAAQARGAQLLAVALPPTVPRQFPVTDTPRYRQIAEKFGMIAHEQGICGCHVHVAVPDREAAIYVSNWLRPWLPLLLALTANSAVYRNTETGYASWRSILWARWPSAGPPPYFESVEDYDQTVRVLLDTGAVLDDAMVYWDVRPSSNYPTIEVRVADVPSTVAESVLLTTLMRAAVMTALDERRRRRTPPRLAPGALRAAYWKAAHDGLAGRAVDLTGGLRSAPTRDLLAGFIERIGPALQSLGEHRRVADELARVAEVGNGAMRQTKAWRLRNNVADVIAAAAAATIS